MSVFIAETKNCKEYEGLSSLYDPFDEEALAPVPVNDLGKRLFESSLELRSNIKGIMTQLQLIIIAFSTWKCSLFFCNRSSLLYARIARNLLIS
jgi:hypothetical protein